MVKKHSVSDTARTASLTDLRRGDGFFGQNTEVGNPTSLRDRSRKSDLGLYRSPLARAWQAGGFYAGQACGAVGRAIKRGWASQYYWASHQTRLNEVGRASTRWASHSTFTASTPASKRLLGAVPTVPARHIYSDIYLVPARQHCKCLLGTFGAYLQVPARRVYLSARSALCLLGTFS